ncbi:MAG: hypothetical protein DSY88_04500, partial [Candidatus Poseidoniales archaeon]
HSHEKPGRSKALIRELTGKPLGSIPMYLGFAWILRDSERRGWHDHIAKTHIIKV